MTFLLAAHFMVVVAFTTRILLRDDLSPPARLAWFIILAVVPYVGSGLYFLFGEVDLGHRADKRHKQVFSEIRPQARGIFGHPESCDTLIDPYYQSAFRYAASINGFFPLAGNQAELMADEATTTASLIADIDRAQSHVHVLYYIWLTDKTGCAVAEALMRAARRGVTCRAMADGLGSRALIRSPLWKQMRDAGVQAAVTLPLNRPLLTLLTSRIDLRNHRKITVIDGEITYCGSRNCADPEFLPKARFGPWVDIMLRLKGPVVAQNELLFISDWMQATGEAFDPCSLQAEPQSPGFVAHAVGDGPTERNSATPQLFASLFNCAQSTITLSTPYFVPDATVLDALCAAAYRGVRVTLIFPQRNDSWIVAAASRSYYRRLLMAGCCIHEFRAGLLHAKTLTIDGKVTLIGSSNLDLRSFDLNYENNVLLQDTCVTQAVYERQAAYIAQSDPVLSEEVRNWPRHQRIWHNVIATIGPVL